MVVSTTSPNMLLYSTGMDGRILIPTWKAVIIPDLQKLDIDFVETTQTLELSPQNVEPDPITRIDTFYLRS